MNCIAFLKQNALRYGIFILAFSSAFLCAVSDLEINETPSAIERKIIECNPQPCKGVQCIKCVPFVIKEPGIYCLADNFTLSNSIVCPTAITIEADNVVLNLGGFTISGGFRGIDIQDCSLNVTVKNGVIRTTNAEGIRVGKGSKNIHLFDLKIIDVNKAGTCDGCAGILFNGVINDNIRDSIVQNVVVTDCVGTGIKLDFCEDCKLFNCCVQDVTSSPLFDANGYFVLNGEGNFFDHCLTSSIMAVHATKNARGFFADASHDPAFIDCKAIDCISNNAGSFGFHILNSQCALAINCSSAEISSNIPLSALGFFSQTSISTIFKGCFACNAGTGFGLNTDTTSLLCKNISINNIANGFDVFNCTNCTTGNNQAEGNTVFGFTTQGGAGNHFFENFAAKNTGGNYAVTVTPVVALGGVPLLGANISG